MFIYLTPQTPRVLAYEDMYKLVKYLTGEFNTEVEKLRAIFRWIASQNLKQWHDEVSFNRLVLDTDKCCFVGQSCHYICHFSL